MGYDEAGMTPGRKPPPGYRWVFCKSFKHWRTGRPVFRRNGGYFRFLVRR